MRTAFFAYDGSSQNSAESAREAAETLTSQGLMGVRTWESLRRPGKLILSEILEQIERSEVFLADCTTLNPNVLFELGFAITRDKHIVISIDTSRPSAEKKYQDFGLLAPVRYVSSSSGDALLAAFNDALYFENEQPTLRAQFLVQHFQHDSTNCVLHLKPRADTNAVKRIGRILRGEDVPLRTDDPDEVLQSLAWYAREIFNARAVLAHFVPPAVLDAELTNARYGLVAGMVHGLNKSLLMVASSDFPVPFDYKTLLRTYKDTNQAGLIVAEWLEPIRNEYREESHQRKVREEREQSTEVLTKTYLGQIVAELEVHELVDKYFVETATYREARDGRCNIFVGRKGVGKSATLYKLRDEIEKEPRSLVCLIKPESYELVGILKLISELGELDTREFALQSIWKYLLLTELAAFCVAQIKQKIPHQCSGAENALLTFVSQNPRLTDGDFSTRLEAAVKRVIEVERGQGSRFDWQSQLSSRLHQGPIKQLNSVLFDVLNEKGRVAILIDNLDKAWEVDSNLSQLAYFVLSLLSVTENISKLFDRHLIAEGKCRLTITLFLRSDIFHRVRQQVRETDKLAYRKISWDDPELLVRVIEDRYAASTKGKEAGESFWKRMFVNGRQDKLQILDVVYPRPRDLIFCVGKALEVAGDRMQPVVRPEDLAFALKEYSRFAFDSIQSESKVVGIDLDSVVNQFIQSKATLRSSQVSKILTAAGVEQSQILIVTRELCLVGFLGLYVAHDTVEFIDDVDNYDRIRNKAMKFSTKIRNREVYYRIRKAFWPLLEIENNPI